MTISKRDDARTTLRRRGVKELSESAKPLVFVGNKAKVSFKELSIDLEAKFEPGDVEVATLGELYETAVYKNSDGSKNYETVYDGVDWSVPAQDEDTKRVLNEIFGNTDTEPTESDKEKIKTIFGTKVVTNNQSSIKERCTGLKTLTGGNQIYKDEDTRGIRGIADFDAPIETIA
jgi:hypothetical protein